LASIIVARNDGLLPVIILLLPFNERQFMSKRDKVGVAFVGLLVLESQIFLSGEGPETFNPDFHSCS